MATRYVVIKVTTQDGYDPDEILNEANYEVSYLDGNNQVIEDTEIVDVLETKPN